MYDNQHDTGNKHWIFSVTNTNVAEPARWGLKAHRAPHKRSKEKLLTDALEAKE